MKLLAKKLKELSENELQTVTGGLEIVKSIKEKLCYVALDPEEEAKNC